MLSEVTGLILRETAFAENDKILSVLTAEAGKLPVYAKGVRSYRNRFMSLSQQMCYNEFVLHEKQGKYWLREAAPLASFYHIRENLSAWALAQYVLDVLDCVCMNEVREPELLKLGLNVLHLLEQGKKEQTLVKAVFEMRVAALAGFLPDLHTCARCDNADGPFYFDVANGGLVCTTCLTAGHAKPLQDEWEVAAAGVCLPLTTEVLAALRFICSAPAKRIFSFSLPDASLAALSGVCETYLRWHTDRNFESLKFYKDMQRDLSKQKQEDTNG